MTNPKLPDFIRRDVERAIEEALHPKGMSTHDGKARIGVDRLQYLMRMIDSQPDEPRATRVELVCASMFWCSKHGPKKPPSGECPQCIAENRSVTPEEKSR